MVSEILIKLKNLAFLQAFGRFLWLDFSWDKSEILYVKSKVICRVVQNERVYSLYSDVP